MTANVAMGENKRCRPVEDLLPGIPDDVVLDKIVPKLEWKDFYILSSVSCAWHNVIRSRRVFESRVLSHSSETFVVCCTHNTIALYSMRDDSWYELPCITDISDGRHRIPTAAEFVSMDGKIYVLGGKIDSEFSNKVFVFDLVGQGGWKQCASMEQQRQNFGTAVMDGKIYVFGGRAWSTLRSSEVYEPKEDTWSPIRPMATCRFSQRVTPIGEELFTYGGYLGRYYSFIDSLEAYHPVKDEWRVVQHSWDHPCRDDVFFTVHGNVFQITADSTHFTLGLDWLSILKYDIDGNSWIHVYSFSFAALIPDEYESCSPCARPDAAFAVDDELVAIVPCWERKEDGTLRLFMFQSTGFGSENQKISWKLRAIITFEPVLQGAEYFVQKL